jgi:hypothetical protein
MLKKAGFTDVEWVAETGFNSSPVTKGVLFRAKKSAFSDTFSSRQEIGRDEGGKRRKVRAGKLLYLKLHLMLRRSIPPRKVC